MLAQCRPQQPVKQQSQIADKPMLERLAISMDKFVSTDPLPALSPLHELHRGVWGNRTFRNTLLPGRER
jgi:hypothetical protein